jgi:hypothetical protein
MVRLHRSTEHRVYALWACPRAAINGQRPPPAATCEPEAGVGFNLRATHENTLVMRRSVAHFSCRQAPGVAPRCRIELLGDQGGGSAAAHPPGAPPMLRGRPSGPKGAAHRACARQPSGLPLTPQTTAAPGTSKSGQAEACPPRWARRATPAWRSTGHYLPSGPSSRRSRRKRPSAIRTVAGWSAGPCFISQFQNRLHLIDKLRRNRSHFGEDTPLIVKGGSAISG